MAVFRTQAKTSALQILAPGDDLAKSSPDCCVFRQKISVVTPSHLAILGEADDEALSKDLHCTG